VDGDPVLYGVTEIPGSPPELRVRILAGRSNSDARKAVLGQVRRQLSTDVDLGPFAQVCALDPVLSRVWPRFAGMRIPQTGTVYEALICAILEQQVNLTFAHQVKKALIETYGKIVDYERRTYNVFPEPASLAITTPGELRRLQISGPKAGYIITISRAALDGTLDLEGLRELEPDAAHLRLLEQKGVGRWTVNYVGMRALSHFDCLPAADVGLQKAVRRLYGLRKLLSVDRVESLARAWKGWRSYATFYLWLTFWETESWRQELIDEVRLARRSRTQGKVRHHKRSGKSVQQMRTPYT
jgi:DNA-3-methyladenine glycosylase II